MRATGDTDVNPCSDNNAAACNRDTSSLFVKCRITHEESCSSRLNILVHSIQSLFTDVEYMFTDVEYMFTDVEYMFNVVE